ncbi:hypothetical protein KSF78_0005276 [Schistosoma japonicum]|nr:hypothetical protein KSF78_0005276 [Schistosoma japonicum]
MSYCFHNLTVIITMNQNYIVKVLYCSDLIMVNSLLLNRLI